MEEVIETTEKRLHRLEVEETQQEEMELRERNAVAQPEEKVMDNKRGNAHCRYAGRNPDMKCPRWKKVSGVEWKRKLPPLSATIKSRPRG